MIELLTVLVLGQSLAIMDSDAPWDVFKNTKDAVEYSMRCTGTCDPNCGPVPPWCTPSQKDGCIQSCNDYCGLGNFGICYCDDDYSDDVAGDGQCPIFQCDGPAWAFCF